MSKLPPLQGMESGLRPTDPKTQHGPVIPPYNSHQCTWQTFPQNHQQKTPMVPRSKQFTIIVAI